MSSDDDFCPLCLYREPEIWKFPNDQREYLFCKTCYLVFTSKNTHPDQQTARNRYLHHLADAGSPGHINHLIKAIQPVGQLLKHQMHALDYGCGPKPVLADLLYTLGCNCQNYDPIFYPADLSVNTYDVIFCIETAEHFSDPYQEFSEMQKVLNPEGLVILMTGLYKDKLQFSNWFYKRDFTHISFFHQRTMTYISQKMNWQLLYEDGTSITVFKKSFCK